MLNFKIHIQVFKPSFQIRTTIHIHLFLFVQSSLLIFQRQFEMTQYIYCYISRLQSPVLNNINNHNFYQTLSDTELTIYRYCATRVGLLYLKLRHLVCYLRCMNLIAHTSLPSFQVVVPALKQAECFTNTISVCKQRQQSAVVSSPSCLL